MDFIRGITFAPFVPGDYLCSKEAKDSLIKMKECTNANYVMFVPNALQDTAQSETIFMGRETVAEQEMTEMVRFAKDLGLMVAIKPTVNCKNGTWRAHINFFDEDVPCEPKWKNWFASYTKFQLRFAKIAQDTGCDMFLPGCEMVMSERREGEWRKLIDDVRQVYSGTISYNTDKYQEHRVTWWDAVDVISSSGYYPIDNWDQELDRIEKVVKKFNKPFFFAECGCMSVKDSNLTPNNWGLPGDSDLEGQAAWYDAMFSACKKRDWVGGHCIWSWGPKLYNPKDVDRQRNYEVYCKPAEKVISEYYASRK